MDSIPKTELEMVEIALASLDECDVSKATEVPFLNRSIDLVYESDGGMLVAIEFKIHDWKRAIAQASDHILGTKEAYICLPRNKISDAIISEAQINGVGVMAWTREKPLDIVLEPPETDLYLPQLNLWLRERFDIREGQGR